MPVLRRKAGPLWEKASPPSRLSRYGVALASLSLHHGSPRRSASEGNWRRGSSSNYLHQFMTARRWFPPCSD